LAYALEPETADDGSHALSVMAGEAGPSGGPA
jgi:hypothetical protein